jgi:glutamyl-tRNA reductase
MALALADGALGHLPERRLLVVGAGRIALQTLKAAPGRGLRELAVANRTPERAAAVALPFGADTYGLDELVDALRSADVVVSATASEEPVISRFAVEQAMGGREGRPLVLVDLAVPADVERSAGDVPGVKLFDVDDLRAGLDDAMASRLREVPQVEAVVAEEVERFGRLLREREVEPVLVAMRQRAESIREAELERTLRELGEVDPEVARRVERFSHALVKKILHEPTARLRTRAGEGDAGDVAELVRELFDLGASRES